MERDSIYHLSMGLVGFAVVVNGATTIDATGVSDVASAVAIVGGSTLALVSGYTLVTGTESDIDSRAVGLSVVGAVLSVAGTVLVFVDSTG